jgi:thioredoxin-like negative regulator of GroEL
MLLGDYSGAAAICREALAKTPGEPTMTKQLAWLLATADDPAVRNGHEAVELLSALPQDAERVDIQYLEALSAAHAEAGNLDQAVAVAQRVVAEARKVQSRRLAEFEARLRLYQSGQPFRYKVQKPDLVARPA